MILDRPRHEKLVDEVRRAGARIKLISDGDVSAALATTMPEAGIDLLLGIGRAPQGIIAAAALNCLGGEMQARLRPRNEFEAGQCRALGLFDLQPEVHARAARVGHGDVRGDRGDAGRLPRRRALRARRRGHQLGRHALGDAHGALHPGAPSLRPRAGVLTPLTPRTH